MNIWRVLITTHTIVATLCFVAGLFLMSPFKAKKHAWLMSVFVWTLFLMLVFMVCATLSHWLRIGVSERIAFSALGGLGLYMLYRGIQAQSRFRKNQLEARYFNDTGFVLIGLFDGFAIVSLLDIKAPVWVIVSGGILAILIGRYFVNRTKRRFLAT